MRQKKSIHKNITHLIKTALMHQQKGQFQQAKVLYNKVLAIDPNNFDALHLSGVLAHQTGNNETAVSLINKALQQDNANPFAFNNLGEAYRALNRLSEAEQCYYTAIKFKPDYFEAYNNLGNALHQLGLPEKAAQAYRNAISLKTDNPGPYYNLGISLTSLGLLNEATQSFQQAVRLNPGYAEAYNNLGNILLDLGQWEEGLEAYRTAIALRPDYDEPHYNLGASFQDVGEFTAAEQLFEKALAINPEHASCKWNLSLIMLLQGRFEDGFKLYENRFKGGDQKVFAKMNRILEQLNSSNSWHGESLQGKALLIIAEQGLGDNLMMMRYFALLKQRSVTRIIVYCEPPLIRLIRHQPDVDDVVSISDPIPFGAFDLYCPSMSLPHLFQTQLESIPNHVPYIVIPEYVKLQWKKRFADISALKVGLVWAGKVSYRKNQLRSMSLQQFGPLLETAGVQFVSLQKGDDAGQLKVGGWDIINWIDECNDLLDTAALIDQLDLVISVDTAVAHLAGALGKPVWMLNRSDSDWRWQLDREDSPWYPTMKIFRQVKQGEWKDVIDRVARALSRFIKTITAEHSENTTCDNPQKWFEQGVALITEGDLTAAEICFRNTLKTAPHSLEAQLNLGYVLGSAPERYEESLHCYESVLKMSPDCAEARYNRAVHLLRRGDYLNGFFEYEFRFAAMKDIDRRIYTQPLWDGSPLNGRTILVVCEQGLGDAIMFARFIPLLAELGGRVVLEVQQPLVTLLASLPGVERIIGKTSSLPVTDCYIRLLSIPHLFKATLESLPCQVPYITAPVQLQTSWQERIAKTDGGYRIGLVWACKGRPLPNRTCPPEYLAPLFSLPATHFFSLQVGEKEHFPLPKELAHQVIDVSQDFRDFADTAACIMALDLVITVDAAVAHLAGALGKQVWVLLPRHSDWRWLLDRSDSPWYPTMRLFRQQTEGDWAGVIAAVKQELAQLLAGAGIHNQHGVELLRQGLASEAEKTFTMAVRLDPKNAEVYCNRGAAQDAQHKYEEALDSYRTAIALRPDFMQAFFNMGNTCRALGNPVAAISCYEQALTLAPDFVPALLCLGDAYNEQHNYVRAQECFTGAIRHESTNPYAYQGLGDTLRRQEEFTNAIRAYQQALAIEPQRASIYNKMGLAHHHAGQFAEAETSFRNALDLAPNDPDILNNFGTLLHSQERINEEVSVYRHLLTLNPTHAEGHWNLSLALLTKGAFVEGWEEYEWRFKKKNPVPVRDFPRIRWDGSPLEGKTILLHCEQGFGDTIQFARYAPLVVQRGGNVVLECQSITLKRLLASLVGVEVVVSGDPLPYFDCHLPLLSLPSIFNTTVESIPAPVPYLYPNQDDVDAWRRRLGPAKAFRIGIVWFARQDQILNRKRSCPLFEFKPLEDVPNCEFYNLQVGIGVEQLTESNFGRRIIDFTADLHDFADTAALMMNLDLVITIDTAAAHLAGALGVPTWVLLPFGAEWRWLQHRTDSPWYPTMRLFRQPSLGDWQTVMREVQEALQIQINTELPTPLVPVPHGSDRYERNVSISDQGTVTRGRLRVGLAWWTGSQDNLSIRKRSCPFSALSPLFDVPNVTFISLQLGAPDACNARLIDFSGHIRNFEDTAALMASLDLIISIDTSVAHLAAATGRPTWVLLPHVADWRWLANRGESIWYPGVKLFWQPDIGDWDGVVREVAVHLAQFPDRLDCQSIDALVNGSFEERTTLELQLEDHRKALCLNASCPDSHLDFGASLALLGRHEEAVSAFRQVLTLNANLVAGHLNLAYSLLALGNYAEGWQHFEWRLQRIKPGQMPPWPMLQRNELGTHRAGSSLLVHCEQGYGDSILFSRFLPLLADAGYKVIVSCQPPLSSLFTSLSGVSQVVPHGELLPVCDLQVPMLSLPYMFSTVVETIPINIPYLSTGNQLKKAWKDRIEKISAANDISPKVY